jgi:hypothetical protein
MIRLKARSAPPREQAEELSWGVPTTSGIRIVNPWISTIT